MLKLSVTGFTLEQAESLSSLFTEIISTSLENVTSNTVSKVEKVNRCQAMYK